MNHTTLQILRKDSIHLGRMTRKILLGSLLICGVHFFAQEEEPKWKEHRYAVSSDMESSYDQFVDEHGNTLLMNALLNEENFETIQLLIEYSDIDFQNHDGITALMIAVILNRLDVAILLIAFGADINIQDDHNITVLMMAIYYHNYEAVQLLVDIGANLDIKGMNGFTALSLAICDDDAPIAQLLIESGAHVNIQNDVGWTPLMFSAFDFTFDDDYNFLINISTNLSASKTQILEKLLESGACVNMQDYNGMTTLMHVAKYGNYQIMQRLLESGADIHIQDYEGLTVFTHTVKNDIPRAIQSITNYRMQNDENVDDALELVNITKNNQHQAIKLLIEYGAFIDDQCCGDGLTALMYATMYHEYSIMQLLSQLHAKITIQDDNGWTALMIAAYQDDKQAVKILLEYYHDAIVHVMMMQNNEGHTALALAHMQGHDEIIALLQPCSAKAWYEFWK